MVYRRSLHVEAPVETVFDRFRDPDNFRELAAEGVAFREVHRTAEGLGTHYTWSGKVAGLTFEGLDVFTEFVPNEKIVDWSSSSLEGTWTYSFEREGSGTKLTLENRKRSLWRVKPLVWLLDGLTARSHDPLFERMKAALEAQASHEA